MGGVNYVTTVIRLRAPGMTYMRMPLTVWGLWLTAILNVLFVPVLAAGVLLLFLDRIFGTHFFVAGAAVDEGRRRSDPLPAPLLDLRPPGGLHPHPAGVGHRLRPPLVLLAQARLRLQGAAVSMSVVTVLSAVVYGHHMFVVGMSPLLGQGFMMLTMLISIPSAVFFLNWLHTIWKGSIRLATPMLFALGIVFVFGLGGLTGLYLGAISTDIYLHDTMFVVGHFHLTMAAAVLLGAFAAIYFWFPKMFGKMMNETLGKWHFWLTIIPITLVFCGMLVVGYGGSSAGSTTRPVRRSSSTCTRSTSGSRAPRSSSARRSSSSSSTSSRASSPGRRRARTRGRSARSSGRSPRRRRTTTST